MQPVVPRHNVMVSAVLDRYIRQQKTLIAGGPIVYTTQYVHPVELEIVEVSSARDPTRNSFFWLVELLDAGTGRNTLLSTTIDKNINYICIGSISISSVILLVVIFADLGDFRQHTQKFEVARNGLANCQMR